MKYMVFVLYAALCIPAYAQDASWTCKSNHRGQVCTDQDGERWRERFDHHGRRVWRNSHGDRVTEYEKPDRTDLNVFNNTIGTRRTTVTGREQLEFINGLLLWCKVDNHGQKTCRQ